MVLKKIKKSVAAMSRKVKEERFFHIKSPMIIYMMMIEFYVFLVFRVFCEKKEETVVISSRSRFLFFLVKILIMLIHQRNQYYCQLVIHGRFGLL